MWKSFFEAIAYLFEEILIDFLTPNNKSNNSCKLFLEVFGKLYGIGA